MMDYKEPKVVIDVKPLVDIIETELKRPLSSKELQIIQDWNYTVEQVKKAVLDGYKKREIANFLGVSSTTISKAIKR